MAAGRRRAAHDRSSAPGRIRSHTRRARQRRRRSGNGPPAARNRRGRLCRHEHHAPIRVGLVGGRCRHETSVSPDFRCAGAPHSRLFGPHLLRFRMGRPARRADEHGRADQRRRAPGLCPQRIRHGDGWTACVFRCGHLAVVFPARGARRGSGDARTCPRGGQVSRADDAAGSHSPDARRRTRVPGSVGYP